MTLSSAQRLPYLVDACVFLMPHRLLVKEITPNDRQPFHSLQGFEFAIHSPRPYSQQGCSKTVNPPRTQVTNEEDSDGFDLVDAGVDFGVTVTVTGAKDGVPLAEAEKVAACRELEAELKKVELQCR
jgi:hypothetical protein